jgi:cell fate regulator YaaT (PSP1 superfamily)
VCIIQVERIVDVGEVKELGDLVEPPAGTPHPTLPTVLRCATLQDQAKADDNALRSRMAMDTCQAAIEKYGLDMRLIRVRYSFDRSVLMVTFSAESRVDFRDMVRDLAHELNARIEMEQIGVRDEAGIIGGIGTCGRKLCCCTWLHRFESVNVKMAKAQNLSLNPGAISGMCGRLKCCLRYEYEHYREMARHCPPDGARVSCGEGCGRVFARDILGQRVKVRLEDDRVVDCRVDELERTGGAA